jgi:hypothetical protein
MSKLVRLLCALAGLGLTAPVHAAETITYTYDAKGRLVKVVRMGTVNNNVQTTYTYDKADNRKTVTKTGAPS